MELFLDRILEVFARWARTGEFPRDEFRFRWWLPVAVIGGVVLVLTVVALIFWAVDLVAG